MDNPAYATEFDKEFGSQKTAKQYSHTFEEAITLTGVGKFHYFLLPICGVCFMAVMAETMGISIIMPALKCDLTSTQSEQGILASAGFLGIVMSSHALGFLADTWGRVRTLRYTLILSAISTIISAFSVNIWMLIVFRFLNGFFISGCQACVFSLCGEFHGNKTRVRHVTLLAGFLPLALIYLPSIAIIILPLRIDATIFGMTFSSWRLFLILNSSLSFFALLGLGTLPETPKYVLVQGDHDGALEVLRKIYAKNTGLPGDDFPVKSIVLQTGGASLTDIHGIKDALRMIWSQTIPLFYKERYLHTINICISLFVIYGISQGTFMWFPTILNELIVKNGQGLKVCNIIDSMQVEAVQTEDVCAGEVDIFTFQVLTMIGTAFAMFYLIFAYTIDIIGKKNLLLAWLCIAGICVTAIHFISEFVSAVVVMTLIMGIGNCGGIISTLSMEFFPTNVNAMGMCFVMMIGRLGAVAGSNILGTVLFANCDLVFWVILGIIFVLCALGLTLPERKREKKNVRKEIT